MKPRRSATPAKCPSRPPPDSSATRSSATSRRCTAVSGRASGSLTRTISCSTSWKVVSRGQHNAAVSSSSRSRRASTERTVGPSQRALPAPRRDGLGNARAAVAFCPPRPGRTGFAPRQPSPLPTPNFGGFLRDYCPLPDAGRQADSRPVRRPRYNPPFPHARKVRIGPPSKQYL